MKTTSLSRLLPHRVLAASALLAAIGTTVVLAQVPIGQIQPEGITIKGKVADQFGDKFVLDDGSGRILVQTGLGGSAALAVTAGETVTAVGLPRDRTFTAHRITRENGEVIFASTEPANKVADLSPAPASSTPSILNEPTDVARALIGLGSSTNREVIGTTLRQAGLVAVGEPVRHPKHIEINARTEAGKPVIVSLDRFGRLDEIEDADHDKHRAAEGRAIGPSDADRLARGAGFTPREAAERRKHHYEIVTTNTKGEIVELHMDLAGNIYKRIWVR